MLDFSQTQILTAMGAVYLYSKIDDRQHNVGQAIRIHRKDINPLIQYVLRNSGLLFLVDGDTEPTGDILPIISGTDDEYIDNIVRFLTQKAVFEQQLKDVDKEEAENLVTRAIAEAMLNVMQHAYADETPAYWWMTADIFDETLNIAFCDRGVGIPKTLPRRGWFEQLKNFSPMNDDAQMIEAAMEYARTSQGSSKGRGLGTRDIQNLILQQKRGHLTIISGKGHYRLTGGTGKVETSALNEDVQGTVIQWTIPMQTTN